MKNKLFHDIALAVGGSHYPNVGGELLEQFGREVVAECIKAIDNTNKQLVYTTFDKDRFDHTIDQAKKAIEERFKE
jgi:hypothetical protein